MAIKKQLSKVVALALAFLLVFSLVPAFAHPESELPEYGYVQIIPLNNTAFDVSEVILFADASNIHPDYDLVTDDGTRGLIFGNQFLHASRVTTGDLNMTVRAPEFGAGVSFDIYIPADGNYYLWLFFYSQAPWHHNMNFKWNGDPFETTGWLHGGWQEQLGNFGWTRTMSWGSGSAPVFLEAGVNTLHWTHGQGTNRVNAIYIGTSITDTPPPLPPYDIVINFDGTTVIDWGPENPQAWGTTQTATFPGQSFANFFQFERTWGSSTVNPINPGQPLRPLVNIVPSTGSPTGYGLMMELQGARDGGWSNNVPGISRAIMRVRNDVASSPLRGFGGIDAPPAVELVFRTTNYSLQAGPHVEVNASILGHAQVWRTRLYGQGTGSNWSDTLRGYSPLPGTETGSFNPIFSGGSLQEVDTWVRMRKEFESDGTTTLTLQSQLIQSDNFAMPTPQPQVTVTRDQANGVLTFTGLAGGDGEWAQAWGAFVPEISNAGHTPGKLLLCSITFTYRPFDPEAFSFGDPFPADIVWHFDEDSVLLWDAPVVDPNRQPPGWTGVTGTFVYSRQTARVNNIPGDLFHIVRSWGDDPQNPINPGQPLMPIIEIVETDGTPTGYGLLMELQGRIEPNWANSMPLTSRTEMQIHNHLASSPLRGFGGETAVPAVEFRFMALNYPERPAPHIEINGRIQGNNDLWRTRIHPSQNWSDTNRRSPAEVNLAPITGGGANPIGTWVRARLEVNPGANTNTLILQSSFIESDTFPMPTLASHVNATIDRENGVLTITGLEGAAAWQTVASALSPEVSNAGFEPGKLLLCSITFTYRPFDPEAFDFDDDFGDVEQHPRVTSGYQPRPVSAYSHVFDLLPEPGTRPRLLLRPEDLPEMQRRINDPLTAGFFAGIQTNANRANSAILPPRVGTAWSNMNMSLLRTIEAKAFLFVIDQDNNQQFGHDAIRMIREYANTFEWRPDWDVYWRGNHIGEIMYVAALVYDWCYPLLTAEDRNQFHNMLHFLADNHEFGYGGGVNDSSSVVTGHMSEIIIRDFLAAGIAMAEHNWRMYYDAARRYVTRFAPAINLYTWMGPHHQGTDYGMRLRWNVMGDLMFFRMLPPEERIPSFSDSNFRGVARPQGNSLLYLDYLIDHYYWFMYIQRPDGEAFRYGDMFNAWTSHHWEMGLYINAMYGDPHIQGYITSGRLNTRRANASPVEAFILFNTDVTPAPVDTMPNAMFWNNGEIMHRTGWSIDGAAPNLAANDFIVNMRIKNLQLGNHDHLDAGSFQIYFRGGLAIDGSHYDAYATHHHISYHWRTISKNSILVRNPNMTQAQINDAWPRGAWTRLNDGGQNFPSAWEPNNIRRCELTGRVIPLNAAGNPFFYWPQATTLAHQIAPDFSFSFIKGDIAELYNGGTNAATAINRAQRINRSMVTLDFFDATYPGALIVFDNITPADPAYDIYFLLQSPGEHLPIIDGDNIIITNHRPGRDGQLINTILLGGRDSFNVEITTGYDVFGTTVPPNNIVDAEARGVRTQISPIANNTTTMMLNVMQVSVDGTPMLPVTQIGDLTYDVVGARIFDRAVLFSTCVNGGLLTGEFIIPAVDGPGERLTYIVTDMAPGNWLVYANGQLIDAFTVHKTPVGPVESVGVEGTVGTFIALSSYELTVTPGTAVVTRPYWVNGIVEYSNVDATAMTIMLTWSGSVNAAAYNIYVNNVRVLSNVPGPSATVPVGEWGEHTFTVEAVSAAGFESIDGPSVDAFVTPMFNVSGTVMLEGTTLPASGAIVEVVRLDGRPIVSSTVGADGTFTVTDVPAGSFFLVVRFGGTTETISIVVDDTDLTGIDIELLPIIDGRNFSPEANQYLHIENPDPAALRQIFIGTGAWAAHPLGAPEYRGNFGRGWIEVDMGGLYTIARVDMQNNNAEQIKYQFWTSEDGVNWTMVLPFPGSATEYFLNPPAPPGVLAHNQLAEPVNARYFRLVPFGNAGSAQWAHWITFRQVQLIGWRLPDEVAPSTFDFNIFNNGPGGTQYPRPNASLAEAGIIRMWTLLDGVGAPVYLAAADTITALDQDENCAMEFVRVGRVWVDGQGWQDYFNLLDVNKNGDWQYIYLSITVFGQTVNVRLANANYRPAAEYHTVTFIVEAGAVGVYAATATAVEVPAGEAIPAYAIPSTVARAGFYFAGWYPGDPVYHGAVTGDTTFTARFNPLFHYVTFEAGEGGTLTAAEGFGLVVRIRDGFTFWADRVPAPVANEGYEFVGWSPSNPAGYVVREDMTFTAVFAEAAPVVPQIISVTNPAVVQQGGTVEIVVTTQGMPDGAWVDLNVAWRPGLAVVGGPRFYVVNNQALITVSAAADARLGRDGFAVAARGLGEWGIPFIIDSYTFVIEVQ